MIAAAAAGIWSETHESAVALMTMMISCSSGGDHEGTSKQRKERERERGRAIIISFLSLSLLSLSFNLPPKSVYTVNTHTLATCLINHPNLNGAFCSLFFSLPFTLQFHICVCVFCFNISNNTLFKGKICVHCYFCCCCCRLQCKGTTTTNTTEKPI